MISGNTDDGVEITGSGTSGNVVAGNLIGTDVDRHGRARQRHDGVEIDTGASGNTIGGTTAAARNIISGNDGSGVEIDDANDNLVEGNFVGTDKTGTVALGNNVIAKNVRLRAASRSTTALPATPSAASPRPRAPARAT